MSNVNEKLVCATMRETKAKLHKIIDPTKMQVEQLSATILTLIEFACAMHQAVTRNGPVIQENVDAMTIAAFEAMKATEKQTRGISRN